MSVGSRKTWPGRPATKAASNWSILLMNEYDSPEIVNVGVGKDLSIAELAEMIRDVVGFEGGIVYDRSKPDGTPRKLVDISRITKLGWKPKIDLKSGIRSTYEWYLQNHVDAAAA